MTLWAVALAALLLLSPALAYHLANELEGRQ